MKNHYSVYLLIVVLFAVNFTSCYNDIDLFKLSDEVKFDQVLVIPIGGSSANTIDVLTRLKENQYLTRDTLSNELYFERYDTIVYKYRDLNLGQNISPLSEDFIFNSTSLPVVLPPNTQGSLTKNSQFVTDLNSNVLTDRLDSIYINSMTLGCNITSQDFPVSASNVKIKIIFPYEYVNISNSNSNSVEFSPLAYNQENEVIIHDVKLFFPNFARTIPVQVEISYNTGNVPVIMNTDSKCTVTFTMKDIDYEVAFGYFDPSAYSDPTETLNLNFFGYLPNGYLRFANPQLFMKASHNIGTHLRFTFDYVRAYLSTDPNFAPIYASFDGSRSFAQTLNKPQSPGNFSNTTMKTFDKDFGNTYLLFDSVRMPDVFEYQFTSSLDTDKIKNDPSPNFLVPNSHINLFLHSKIMLYFNEGSFYEHSDTTELENQLDAELSSDIEIDTCFIVLNVVNAFPCQAIVKLQMLDSMKHIINNNMIKEYTVQSANVDENGTVIKGGENKQIIKIAINQSYLDDLKRTKYFVINLKIAGENENEKIHLTQDNYIDAQAGLYIKFKSNVHLRN